MQLHEVAGLVRAAHRVREHSRRAEAGPSLGVESAHDTERAAVDGEPAAEGAGVLHRGGEVALAADTGRSAVLRAAARVTAIRLLRRGLDEAIVSSDNLLGVGIVGEVG